MTGTLTAEQKASLESALATIEQAFRDRDFHRGALEAVAQAAHLLISHFPSSGADSNELPDRPLML